MYGGEIHDKEKQRYEFKKQEFASETDIQQVREQNRQSQSGQSQK